MATFLDLSVARCLGSLAAFVEGEECKVLGVKKDVEMLQAMLAKSTSFLQDAERKRQGDASINAWVQDLKDGVYDADDLIDLCAYRGRELLEARPPAAGAVSPLSSLSFRYRCKKCRNEMASAIKALGNRLKKITEDRSILSKLEQTREQAPRSHRQKSKELEFKDETVGAQIENASHNLISLVLKNEKHKCRVFGIVGLGGIGKTTLARKIFNDERIKGHFLHRVWLPISEMHTDLLPAIFQGAGENVHAGADDFNLQARAPYLLKDNFLLVLDDVRERELFSWNFLLRPLIQNAVGSVTVLVTSRDDAVATTMGASYAHNVEKMDTSTGWELLCTKVFAKGEEEQLELEETGRKIVEKCDGLPLAIEVVGGVLACREKSKTEWEKVLESDSWHALQIDELPKALRLSYEDLPSHLKQCFLYFALYNRSLFGYFDLYQMWMAEGFVVEQRDAASIEDLSEEYGKELTRRNLLKSSEQTVQNGVFVHHHLQALAAHLVGEEATSIDHGQPSNYAIPSAKIRRMSMSNVGFELRLRLETTAQNCLRSLLVLDSPLMGFIFDDVFEKLTNLRVLYLSKTFINVLPDSLWKLLHLRYLNLRGTKIAEVSESIGNLVNLQHLDVSFCQELRKLPRALARLRNLRVLAMQMTPLAEAPKGVGRLLNLYHLYGFVVGPEEGCELEELRTLHQLRWISVSKMEWANPGGGLALANATFLKHLYVSWSPSLADSQIQGADMACSRLSPPPSLQYLSINWFPGRRFPGWLMMLTAESFPHLENLSLVDIPSSTELPPLGRLPQLKVLVVVGAISVIEIGDGFFGGRSTEGAPAFPKLEVMKFIGMPNWEQWASVHAALPNLCVLILDNCPKLSALPESLRRASKLHELHLYGTRSLREIADIPSVRELYMILEGANALESIADLPALRILKIRGSCPELKRVSGVGALRQLYLKWLPPMERLPQWLLKLLEELRSAPSPAFRKLEMYCWLPLLKKTLMDEEHWEAIREIPEVSVDSLAMSAFMRYSRDPFMYNTNVATR